MDISHQYQINVNWTGNRGQGTTAYDAYDRSHTIQSPGKKIIECSSDAPFMGDVKYYNPEDMFLSALSTCHMLWYLHLCADAGVVVTSYTDKATGVLTINPTGISKFTEIVLFPTVKVQTADMIDKAISLHHQANKKCFIANSCNVIVKHQPTITI